MMDDGCRRKHGRSDGSMEAKDPNVVIQTREGLMALLGYGAHSCESCERAKEGSVRTGLVLRAIVTIGRRRQRERYQVRFRGNHIFHISLSVPVYQGTRVPGYQFEVLGW